MTVAILGTGQMGTALSRALARANVPLAIGSRDASRAEAQAVRLTAEFPAARVSAAPYRAALRSAEIVILAVDFDVARALISEWRDDLRGRIVVDPTTPWGQQIPAGSGSLDLARRLAPGTPLVAAWKTTFAGEVAIAKADPPVDVLLCADDGAAKAKVAELVRATGARALDCGGLEHAGTLEGMTRMVGPILRNLRAEEGTVPAFRFTTRAPGR